jgi:prefoldin subunit 5
MLYHPWRVEKQIIGKINTYCQRFENLFNISNIQAKMEEYDHTCPEIANAIDDLKNMKDEEMLVECTSNVVQSLQRT